MPDIDLAVAHNRNCVLCLHIPLIGKIAIRHGIATCHIAYGLIKTTTTTVSTKTELDDLAGMPNIEHGLKIYDRYGSDSKPKLSTEG